MAVTAGFKTKIKFKVGTTAFVTEAMTAITTTRFVVTDAAKRTLDPEVALSVFDNAVLVPSADYSVNHLMGAVTFLVAPTGPVTITGSALQLADAIKAKGASFSINNNMLDDTVFGDTAVSRCPGLQGATGSVSRIEDGLQDYDPGGGVVSVFSQLTSRTYTVVEMITDSVGSPNYVHRAFALFEADEVASAADDLYTAALTWQSTLVGFATESIGVGTFGQ